MKYCALRPCDMVDTLPVDFMEGGQAKVYFVSSDKVWKVFHQPTLEDHEKLVWQMNNPMPANPSGFQDIAWPERLVFQGGKCVGYEAMYADGMIQLAEALDIEQRKVKCPEWTYRHSVRLASNLAHAFTRVHNYGVVIGDVSPCNVLFSPSSAICCLIDCDSFQVQTGTKMFPCYVSTSGYTAPEVLEDKVPVELRTRHQDAFGLAALVFQLLFEYHPFAAQLPTNMPGMPLDARIRKNLWVGNVASNTVAPPFGLFLDTVTDRLRAHCDKAFNTGFVDANSRPRAREFATSLDSLFSRLKPCARYQKHWYFNDVSVCPWCEKRDRTGQDSFV